MTATPTIFFNHNKQRKNIIFKDKSNMELFFILFFLQNYLQTVSQKLKYDSELNENNFSDEYYQIKKIKTNHNIQNYNSTSEKFNALLQYLNKIKFQIQLDVQNDTELHIRKEKNEDKYYVTLNHNNKKIKRKQNHSEYKIPFTKIFYLFGNYFNFHFTFKNVLVYEIPCESEKDDKIIKPSIILENEHLNSDDFKLHLENIKVYWHPNYNFIEDENLKIFITRTKNIEFIRDAGIGYVTILFSGENQKKEFWDIIEGKQESNENKKKFLSNVGLIPR